VLEGRVKEAAPYFTHLTLGMKVPVLARSWFVDLTQMAVVHQSSDRGADLDLRTLCYAFAGYYYTGCNSGVAVEL